VQERERLSMSRPEMGLERARALLQERGVEDAVALIGVRGFFAAMGTSPGNDPGLYDDAAFLVTPRACEGFAFNTDPTSYAPPNVMLKAGLWRYRPGRHTSPTTGESHDALVHEGRPVWVIARPRSLDDYRRFAELPNVGLRERLESVAAYQDALRARGGKVLADGTVEWPMAAHINIHRGGAEGTSSKGCQTVQPSLWGEFIQATYHALREAGQADIAYLLVEAEEWPSP
jgi:lysozyme